MFGKQTLVAGCLAIDGAPRFLTKQQLNEIIQKNAPKANVLKYEFQESGFSKQWILWLDSSESVEHLCDEIQEEEISICNERYTITYHKCDQSCVPENWLKEEAATIKSQPDDGLQQSDDTGASWGPNSFKNTFEEDPDIPLRCQAGKIKLSNLPEDTDEEYLEMYFEQKFGSDTKTISIELIENGTAAIIEFEKQEVNEMLIKRQPIDMEDQKVYVELFVTQQLKEDEPKTIEVTSEPGVITEKSIRTIKMYFSNKGRSDGGNIAEFTLSEETETITITFESAETAKTVAARHDHKYRENLLNVVLLDADLLRKRREADAKRKKSKAIIITNLPNGVDKSTLELVFEDAETFGEEFHVVNVELDPDTNTAIVEFENSEAVETVVQKKEVDIEGQKVHIEVKQDHIQEEPCTVEVRGPLDCIKEKTLKLYFNNKRRSGGENVTECRLTEPGVAEVTFETSEIAKQVAEKDDHKLKSQHIQVALKPMKIPETTPPVKSNKLLISGVNAAVREILALHLEDMFKDVHVIGECPGEEDSTVILELNGPSSAQTILKSQPICIDGHTLDVKTYRDEPDRLCTIQVQGLPNIDRQLDAVTLYFKNTSRSGGGPVVKCTSDKDNNVAYVTFETEEVAQSVVGRPEHYLKGQLLDVSLYKPKDKSGNACKDSAPTKILITGLPSSVDKEFLELYFEGFECTCEMQVESADINPDEATAVVQFHDQAAVDFILRSQNLQMKGQAITVQVYEEEKKDFCTIEVHGPSNIESDSDKLLLYFKNKRRSDGGVIVNSSVDTGKNVAYITFEDQEVAKRVVAKDHSNLGLEVMLVTDQSTCDSSTDQNVSTVKVRGVQKTVTKETLTYFFESERRGGPIESIWSDDEDKNVVFIKFSKSGDARKVVDRSHEIQECTLQASLYFPPPCYDNKVLIKGLQSTKDALFLFLEATANAEPISIDYHEEEESTVLVTMKNTIDFEKLEKACKERTLEGTRLKVSKVQVSNCIFVSNLAPEVTKDTIQYYFENKKKSGGGDVEKVLMNEDEVERTCLVYFEDYKVIDIVLDRKHTLGGKELGVKCFQTALGRPEGETEERTFKVPRDFEIKDADPHKVKFVANSPEYRKSFEQELLKHYTKVKWPTDTDAHMNVHLHCTLTKNVKGCFKIAKRWEKEAKSMFPKLMDAIVLYRIDVLQDIKPKVMDFLKNTQISEPANVAIVIEKEQKVIVIVGKKAVADDLKLKIEDTIKKIIDDAEKERQKVTEVFTNLMPIETKMMVFEKLQESLEKEFGDIKVQIKIEKNEIHLQGLISSVRNAKLAIYDKKSKFVIQRIDNISKPVLSLLRLDRTSSSLQQKLQSDGIPAVWEIYTTGIAVCCGKPGCCEKAVEVIRTFFQEDTISIERGTVPDLETEKWKSKVEEIHAMHPGKVEIGLSDDLTKIHVCGTADIEKSVTEEVQSFLQINTLITKNVSNSREAIRFLEKNCKVEIDDISRKLQQYYVKIKSLDQYRGFEIRGLQKGVQEANIQLQKLMNKIQQKKHTVSKPGIAEHIRSPKGKDNINTIETTLSCVIVVEGDEAYKQMTDKAHGTRTHASCNVFQGTTIYVWQGDMTELDVGVLVNPSDKNLGFSGGLGKAIISKGGPTIKHECESFIESHKSLDDGEVFMSSAGDLKAEYIAHIKSQHWDIGKAMDKDLEATVCSCLQETSKLQEKSVAIPAIGCGLNGFPVEVATSSIVNAIKRMLMEYQDSSICEVYLCDMNENNVQAFTDALCKIFGRTNIVLHEGGETVRAGSSSVDNLSGAMGARPKRVTSSRRPKNTDRNELSRTMPIHPKHEGIAVGNILVTVVKGEIARQKVDVIVNTTSKKLDLRNGAVSQTLLKTAGKELQDEVYAKYPKGLEGIDVAVTTGHKLNCEFVIHTALSNFNDKKPKESIKALHKLIMNCLDEAQRHNCQSIAFPAIGTGSLGFPRHVVAEEMFKAITKFQAKYSQSRIKDVRFIVYQMDGQTMTEFNAEQSRLQKEVQARTFSGQSGQDASSLGYDIVQANSDNSDTSGSGNYTFGSLTVTVKQSDITQEDADCIVNSTNIDLNLTRGEVSRTLMEKGGLELQEEIENHKSDMRKCKITTTLAPGLPCRNIIHVVADSKDVTSTVKKCLKEAENERMKSIALPAFGTGNIFSGTKTFNTDAAAEIAKNMVKAVREFSKTQPKYLLEVRFVILQNELLQEFLKASQAAGDQSTWFGHVWKGVKNVLGMAASGDEKGDRGSNVEPDFNSVTFIVFALSEDTIRKALRKLENSLEKEIHTKVIPDHTIRQLEDHQVDEMNGIAIQCHVHISINKDKGIVKLTGMAANVMNAAEKINALLRDAERMELMKNIAQWFYIEVAEKGETVHPYEKDINLTIENAYRQQKDSVTYLVDGIDYILDFASMEEYPEHDTTDRAKVMRRDLVKGGTYEVPALWDDMQGGNLRVVSLKSDSSEYKGIEQRFQDSAKRNEGSNEQTKDWTVVKIERIQNKSLWEQYQSKKKQLEDQNPPGTINERELWHGTSVDPVDSINAHGFNRSFCGKNGTVFGDGVYFAIHAWYSCQNRYSKPDAQGIRRMYLCKVLAGEYAKGEGGMRVPPLKPSGGPNARYDSVTNDMITPQMFVIFHDTQACPEYLIYFKE
ncbi:protein mono-ADP-ribosyltransferase PARP14-like isoform X2 [Mercenaria mercenaria]|uniref:protein mono-ADP-ribosyltransferase PARP14-like isoform X2 n=1 Tax=Mercenaria mercenaria TaxID=6596 RepID=UPI00234E59E9|nr:protein mono-ADP-ribosyltransferase PARP14-like isoform X2 [Mercenaria mercenaria]